ncbi:MAG: hypothetical protein ACRD4R_02530 [Candidatus Acidiferrales bacterium]
MNADSPISNRLGQRADGSYRLRTKNITSLDSSASIGASNRDSIATVPGIKQVAENLRSFAFLPELLHFIEEKRGALLFDQTKERRF